MLADLGYEPRAERSEHDLALIDEATALIGTITTKRGRKAEPPKIDSALERTLSEMGLLPSCPECDIELSVEGTKWRCDECWQRFKWTEVMSDAAHKQLLDVIDRVVGDVQGVRDRRAGLDLRARAGRRSAEPHADAVAHAAAPLPGRVVHDRR